MSLVARYRAWACDVPEGTYRRDWRLHPIRLYRSFAFQADSRRYGAELAVREILGLRLRFRRRRVVLWGHRGLDCSPAVPRPGRLYTADELIDVVDNLFDRIDRRAEYLSTDPSTTERGPS